MVGYRLDLAENQRTLPESRITMQIRSSFSCLLVLNIVQLLGELQFADFSTAYDGAFTE